MTSRGDIACFGECMVEMRQEQLGVWRQAFAGDVLNTAVYLARALPSQDLRVRWVSAMGDDHFAAAMAQFWRDEGLDTQLVRLRPAASTGLYAIHVDALGERSFSYWRSTSAAREYFSDLSDGLSPLEQSLNNLQGLHFSGISLAILPPQGRQRLLNCARVMRQRGAWVSFDSNYRPRLWESTDAAQSWMRQALGICDHALVSLDDWQALTGIRDSALIWQELCASAPAELVVKRGAQDTWLRVNASDQRHITVLPVTRPVDTTAAGDAFAAAYLAARIRGLSSESAVMAGHHLAREVIMQPGAIVPRNLAQTTPSSPN